ncbi:hypothetical protein ACFFHM_09500 [Halalkalibacter kiskunsagensis]|uniref:Uncharacterized protein n=1 Tax=Halalkalibacter kiskunsagensis TaxID=1548599 RepID=A0ABV6KBQ1_9BACI
MLQYGLTVPCYLRKYNTHKQYTILGNQEQVQIPAIHVDLYGKMELIPFDKLKAFFNDILKYYH